MPQEIRVEREAIRWRAASLAEVPNRPFALSCASAMANRDTRSTFSAAPGASEVRVSVVAGPSAGARATAARVTVGRAGGAALLVDDPAVSDTHLEVAVASLGIAVRDLGSTNGTFFAGARLGSAIVPDGAELTVGASVLRIDVVGAPAWSSAPRRVVDPGRRAGLVGTSAPMREVFALLDRLAPTELAVLIEGPTGSGKELVARALHEASPRAGGPFAVLDCTALPTSLAESVLFGHVAGAFTGAEASREGIFEAANGGTVFLDEVGDLPLDLQPKLLRVLEQREVTRIGENRPRPVSARVVSATWRSLRSMARQGGFRDDLYYRLAQSRITLPALSERRDDIEALVVELLGRLPPDVPCARSISGEALERLRGRAWSGNVRELKNAVERAAFTSAGSVIHVRDLSFDPSDDEREAVVTSGADSNETPEFKGAKRVAVDDFERRYLERLMAKTNGNIAMAAGLAGIERHYLRSLLKKHGLHSPD